MYFHHVAAYFGVSNPWGSTEGFSKVAVEEKPKRFHETESGGQAEEHGSMRSDQGGEVPRHLVEV